jgi:excisionase family DNA binding protein
MEDILTPVQVAELLKIHVKTVYKLAKQGTLSGHRIGRSWRFSRRRLIELLSSPNGFTKETEEAAAQRTGALSQ